MLGEQADLQVERRAAALLFGHAILADQNEGRQEYRLDRCGHAEHHELLVPRPYAGNPAEVCKDPEAEKRQMDIDEREAACEVRDLVREALVEACGVHLLVMMPPEGIDVPVERGVEALRVGRRYGRAAVLHPVLY